MKRNSIKKKPDKKEEPGRLLIGTHLSVAGGYEKMGKNAVSIGANTLQFFIRNPRGARAKAFSEKEMEAFADLLRRNHFGPILAHAPYTMNPCSPDGHIRELAAEMFAEDLRRLEYLPGNLYNLHPGSRLGQDMDTAAKQIADMLNRTMFPQMHTTVLLETMSGKGSEVGWRFEELEAILDRVKMPEKTGVCMDACHMWDSGYDIVRDLDGVLEQFDRIIGLDRLRAFHINDSMNPIASRKDRHTTLGDGCIGKETIVKIINHPSLSHLPFILETPTDLEGHAGEIRMLKSCCRIG